MKRTEAKYDFRKQYCKAHKRIYGFQDIAPEKEEYVLKDGITIATANLDTVGKLAAKDFADYDVFYVLENDAYYGNPYVRRYAETVREEDSQRLERVFCFGGWDTSDGEDEPEIKEERGGALDEFLDEFKPQTTPERSDEQK